MPIPFTCPSCKARYDVMDDLAGKKIMCRVCQKRGPVPAAPPRPSAPPAAATSANAPHAAAAPAKPSRRNLVLIIAGAVGALTTGAILARRPWRHWGDSMESAPPDDPANRRRGKGKRGGPGGGPGGPPPGGPPPGGRKT
jgi:hypothetical protein